MIYEIIGLACLTNLLLLAEPVNLLYDVLFKKNNYFKRMLTCALCSGFWIYLVYQMIATGTIDLMGASISAIVAELINRKLNTLNI